MCCAVLWFCTGQSTCSWSTSSPHPHATRCQSDPILLNTTPLQELEDLEREHEALKQAVEGKVRRWVGGWAGGDWGHRVLAGAHRCLA